ncbi:MAG: N-acetylmuramoyl-L-alanine amidase [Spirochaetes bacterium]|nr:N-acetylmuramoyl-L-alanine amidase [Spirochaetota bacterium]
MKKIIIAITLCISSVIYSNGNNSVMESMISEQPDILKSILESEKTSDDFNELVNLINETDEIYGSLSERLNNGGKIVIFFDPAHGKLPGGKWQGETTFRMSSSGLPEEIYSIMLSRKLYSLLKSNKYIEVKSTDDFMNVLENKSETYKNITFTETMKLAKENKAFLVISSHLNNVGMLAKAEGLANIRGIHLVYSQSGKAYLSQITDVQSGFLTLYNRYDPTGFTEQIANTFKKEMLTYGYKYNNWKQGAVADDRFLYFANFPLSLMFESGFISNPVEDEYLRNEKNQNEIALSQYNAIINAIDEKFGVDLTENSISKSKTQFDILTLIKLAKMVNYYTSKTNLVKAANICTLMEKNFKSSRYETSTEPYREIRNRVLSANYHLNNASANAKKKRYSAARYSLQKSFDALGKNPYYYPVRTEIAARYKSLTGRNIRRSMHYGDAANVDNYYETEFPHLGCNRENHSPASPFILIVRSNQSLEEAMKLSISPSEKYCSRILESLKNARATGYTTQKRYLAKKKRYVNVRIKRSFPVRFTEGIYIVQFDKNMAVRRAEKVKIVPFDPKRFQNQEYFKNSSLAVKEKEKSL